tara:strand:- start:69 stop:227 length:159 start_codon:yes stop_codon:yes gene_type:complete
VHAQKYRSEATEAHPNFDQVHAIQVAEEAFQIGHLHGVCGKRQHRTLLVVGG